MLKDDDCRGDDDSAIGDSEHYSAEEENSNSRRKSSTSDDVIGLYQIDPFAHLSAKVGSKVPECLRKGAEKSVENCRKPKNSKDDNNNAKNKRVITVLPASAMQSNIITSPKRKQSTREDKTEMDALETKLQFLILEMKKLRDIDHDILRKFVRINDSVDEMKWKIEENEADMKRILESDVTLSDSRTFEDLEEKPDELDMTYVPVTVAATSYASLTSAKSKSSSMIHNYARVTGISHPEEVTSPPKISDHRKPNVGKTQTAPPQNNYPVPAKRGVNKQKRFNDPHSFTNPTYSHVNVGQQQGVNVKDETTENGNYYGQNLKRSVSAFSAVPPKRGPRVTHEPLRTHNHQQYQQQQILQQKYQQQKQKLQEQHDHAMQQKRLQQQQYEFSLQQQKQQQYEFSKQQYEKQQQKYQQQQYSNNSNYVSRKYNARLQQNGNVQVKNSAFRTVSQEHYNNNLHHSFKEQPDYQNLIGLSRVRAQNQSDPRKVAPSRSSTRSLTSSSSLTSSTSSSSSSIVSPNRVSRSNSSSKWSKLSFNKLTKSNSIQEKVTSLNKSDRRTNRNNYNPQQTNYNDVIPRDDHVIAVSYKRTANDSVYNWIRNQDDVTYL